MFSQPCAIELLGGLRVRQGERIITRFRTQKTAALLAYLAYYRDRAHPRELLAEQFWPDSDPKAGRDNVNVALSSLRRQLEPPGTLPGAILHADRFTLQIGPGVTTDVAAFEAALQAAERSAEEKERARHLAEALAVYRHPLLPGYYEEWILPEQERLAARYFEAVTRLTDYLAQAGEIARALDYARQALGVDSLREEVHENLMRLLLAAGQPAAALQQYRELTRLLQAQLGLTPCFATRQLATQIAQELAAPSAQPQAQSTETPNAAPPALTPNAGAEGLNARHEVPPLSGTLTFLRAEIVLSSPSPCSEALRAALTEGMARISRTCLHHGGREIDLTETSLLAAFGRASDAIAGAVQAQQALSAPEGPEALPPLQARMALDTQEVRLKDGRTRRSVLLPVTRLLPAAHPGQTLCTEQTAVLLRRDLPPNVRPVLLGSYHLPDLSAPECLFEIDYPGRKPETFPPPLATPASTSPLPLPLTRFWGRDAEIARLLALLESPPLPNASPGFEGGDISTVRSASPRLITLTGPGGIGKTRLAVEVARRLQQRGTVAVWFVPLENATDARQVVDTLRDVLGLPRSTREEAMEQIVTALNRQPVLLTLDNFEALVEPAAGVVQELLERVPNLTCLVTSRQALELDAEQEFPLSPLPLPPDAGVPEQLLTCPSVQLFVDRAQARRPDFQITGGNAAAVAALCQKLEGIPLALELAAAWAQTLSPVQMLSRVSQRFDLLVSGRSGRNVRHSSLRAAIESSYRLLTPPLQQFFARLSVFRGGWTLEAAETVCAEPEALAFLQQLQSRSLFQSEEAGEILRFRMLESLREFAAEQISPEAQELYKRRHADYYRALAEASKTQAGAELTHALERLEAEHDNLRAALRWCLEEGKRDKGKGIREEEARQEEREADPSFPFSLPSFPSSEVGLRLAWGLSRFWEIRGYGREGRAWLEIGLAANPNAGPALRADALGALGLLALRQGDYEAARSYCEQSLALYGAQANPRGIGRTLNSLGMIAREQSDYATARALYQESLALWQALGDDWGASATLNNLGSVAYFLGDYTAARALYQEALDLFRRVGNQAASGMALANLGMVAHAEGDLETARALHQESLAVGRQLGYKHNISIALHNLGNVMRDSGDYAHAQELLEECLAIKRELADRQGIASVLGDIGTLRARQNDSAAAQQLWQKSLQIRRATGDRIGIVLCLEALATLAVDQGRLPHALTLYAAASAQREALHVPLTTPDRAEQERFQAELRTTLGESAFASGWDAGRLLTLEEAAILALS